MQQYKSITLSATQQNVVEELRKHVHDMFPTAKPAGHDWQHMDSQLTLWLNTGGSILEEPQFITRVDPFLVCLYIMGHDLNRLPLFEPMSKSLKKKTEGLSEETLVKALKHNETIDAFNERAESRMTFMYGGLLRKFGIDDRTRGRLM